MPNKFKLLAASAALACAAHASAQVTFFEREGFAGRSFTASGPINNFERSGFNDAASSVVIRSGWWELCSDARFSAHA